MPFFRKKPVTIQADRWFKNGDHPEDRADRMGAEHDISGEEKQGLVVRYYRHPSVSGDTICRLCFIRMQDHGWINTLEGGHIVCPGDYIITGVRGERYPCKPDIFEETYEEVPRGRN